MFVMSDRSSSNVVSGVVFGILQESCSREMLFWVGFYPSRQPSLKLLKVNADFSSQSLVAQAFDQLIVGKLPKGIVRAVKGDIAQKLDYLWHESQLGLNFALPVVDAALFDPDHVSHLALQEAKAHPPLSDVFTNGLRLFRIPLPRYTCPGNGKCQGWGVVVCKGCRIYVPAATRATPCTSAPAPPSQGLSAEPRRRLREGQGWDGGKRNFLSYNFQSMLYKQKKCGAGSAC